VASNGTRTTLISFTGTSGAAKGSFPGGGLVLGADGSLYGTTTAGGSGDYGTMFRVTTDGNFTTLVEFSGTGGLAKGAVPNELVLSSDGASTDDAGGRGERLRTVFKYTPLLRRCSARFSTFSILPGRAAR
jgi:uncharacterized repeat protein (TIGR03803 family)